MLHVRVCREAGRASGSVAEFAESGSDGTLSVRRVLERHVVAGAPGELGAQAGVDAVLDVALG